MASSVRRGMRYSSPPRPAAHGSTGRQRLLHPVSARKRIQRRRYRLGTTARSRAPGRHTHERGDEQQVHGFPLLILWGLDGFQYINHFKRGQCSFSLVPALVPARSIACSMLQWSEPQKQPEFRCPGQHAPGRCLHRQRHIQSGQCTITIPAQSPRRIYRF